MYALCAAAPQEGYCLAWLAVVPTVDIPAQGGIGRQRLQRSETEDEPPHRVEVIMDEEGEGQAHHEGDQAERAIPAIEWQHGHVPLRALTCLQDVAHAVPEAFAQEGFHAGWRLVVHPAVRSHDKVVAATSHAVEEVG